MWRTVATQLRRKQDLDTLPDGTFSGVWGGHQVTFSIAGIEYEARTQHRYERLYPDREFCLHTDVREAVDIINAETTD